MKFLPGRSCKVYFLCFFTFMVGALFGQSEQFRFKQIDLKDGLSHPDVWTIFKDSRGFVWIGTADGLNRFDGYAIKSFINDPLDTTSLPGDGVYKIFETPDRRLLILTTAGFTLYDPENETFERHLDSFFKKYRISERLYNIIKDSDGFYWFVQPDKLVRYHPKQDGYIVIENIAADPLSIVKDEITGFCVDKNRNYWLIHANGIIERIEIHNQQGVVAERVETLQDVDRAVNNYQITADTEGDLWISAPGATNRVFVYDVEQKKLTGRGIVSQLNAKFVSGQTVADNDLIWVGTDHGGINILDKRTASIKNLFHVDGDHLSLASNAITCLYKDDQGIVWIGTYKRGVSYYHPNIYQFDIYKHNGTDPHSLPFEDINSFEEDKKGNLWIGTNGGGLLYFDRHKGTFKQYLNVPGNQNSLSGNVVVSLCLDTDDNLWIGTYKNGLNKFDGKNFTRFTSTQGDTTSLPSMDVWEIFQDSQERIWIGTTDAGAALFDKKTGKFHRLKLWGTNALQSPTIEAICEDRHGNIWFGTFGGIDVLSANDKTFRHFGYSAKPNCLSSNTIFDIMKDSKGRLWIGTARGLNIFDESINGFIDFQENSIKSTVVQIQEDNIGDIWISTLNGLSKITLAAGSLHGASLKRYNELDGLQGRQFNSNAGFKTKNGELLFGGPTGFNILGRKQHGKDLPIEKVIFSELELYEKRVDIGEKIDGLVILKKSISETDQITLPPNKNFFSLKLSSLNYLNPERDHYIYQLEGLNEDWLPVDSNSHEIVFNGLNPGRYLLRVRASNGDGVPSKNDAILAIIIQPPFWKSRGAFLLYGLFVIVVLFFTRKAIQHREKMKFSIEQERSEMQRLHELDMLKVKFFTNVSHEFRTPLTLILTPMEKLIKKAKDPEQLTQFQLVLRNGKRLMNLVNQLLDFKKLEVHEIPFRPSKGDVIAFIRDTVFSFSDLAEKKNINLSFDSVVNSHQVLFDHDKLEKILFNLLSNAFKFTLENGGVSVRVDLLLEASEQLLRIDVSDTGIGIPADKLDKIFEPFFQTDIPKSVLNQGSGIGLAITKEFVKIHGGSIQVKSEVGVGSSFKVMLPLRESQDTLDQIEDAAMPDLQYREASESSYMDEISSEKLSGKTEKKSLLLIDDNDDFRFYLRDNLKFLYTIHEAANGSDGLDCILSLQPDLIVSDIAMPYMDGIELCTKVKSDERVSHIPVILLTARSNEEQRIEGLKAGADDYITKPFNFEVLEARINNLLHQREKFQRAFRKTLDIKSSELQITPLDVKFIEKAVKIVEANISSPSFSIQELGMELGISRAYVFKKIQALSGKTPLEFIRTIRLQHAAQLLERSQLTVREVGYSVGFNTPKYFTKYFKEQYGVLPSEYLALKKKGHEDPEIG
ncbi:hybrid sensor histidine kinase/response regulator transcription factor [Ohtaekwangia koreensis]|uniref:histidine kinase n=1 Tax=Ohtaekwangia koreensis TaxID=688867 RepID=A0A1T5KIK9_9BACT|nr:hybrid sensor histidine kinase/response regulator transcription factor [Ohtaekwangia koreensis]SKC63574.1 Signal transduction histidine kinase [Ohtaekwangia koreensis]